MNTNKKDKKVSIKHTKRGKLFINMKNMKKNK